MTLYRMPSGRLVSDREAKEAFAEEFPEGRPEADPDYVANIRREKGSQKKMAFSDGNGNGEEQGESPDSAVEEDDAEAEDD